MVEKKVKLGRPAEMHNGRRVYVYLDDYTATVAKVIGKGSISQGIRMSVANFAESSDDWSVKVASIKSQAIEG